MSARSAKQVRAASAGIAALLLHAALALFLAISVTPLRAPPTPLRAPTDVSLTLTPLAPRTPRQAPALPSPLHPTLSATPRTPSRPSAPAPSDIPSPPPAAPAPAIPSRSAPAGSAVAGTEPGGDAAGAEGVRRALRSATGCAAQGVVQMDEADRDACRRSFARDAALGAKSWVDPISNIRKRVYYDQVKQAYDDIRTYNPVNGPMGGRGLSAGCGAQGCKIVPPRGFLTEEAGIEKP